MYMYYYYKRHVLFIEAGTTNTAEAGEFHFSSDLVGLDAMGLSEHFRKIGP